MEALKARPELLSLIQSVSEENGINNCVISDVRTNQKGEGYLGQIFMVTVKDKNGKQLDLVVKAAFIDEKVRDIVPIRMSFQNEINFYINVLPAFMKLEKEHGITESTRFVPKCLKVSLEEEREMLILENLKEDGFEIFDKKLILDEDHVKLIFQNYGRVHGYSYVLRDQKPEEYARITKGLYNVYEEFTTKEYFPSHLADLSKTICGYFIPGEDDAIIDKFDKYTGKSISDIFIDSVTTNLDYPAILHGDCWSNNMLFKYENSPHGRRPMDMRLIDWQLIKVGSPVCDLSYCLYSGASKKIFDNLNEYLQIYYDSFSKHVKLLGSDPEKLFPFSALKEHWRKYSRFGMIMSLSILRMKLTDQEDIVDLTDGINIEDFPDVIAKQRFDEDGYRRRIKDLLHHMAEVDAL